MKWILGVDEAGRGPLAGPVAVAAVAAPEGFDFAAVFPNLNDSKKLTEKAREKLFAILEDPSSGVAYHVELVSPQVIDTRGISHAVRSGVEAGVQKLLTDPAAGKVWLDGALRAPTHYEQETVIGGDATIPAIMLASIAAKVTRDRYMTELALEYPQYAFERHKGYGTAAHYEALREHGLCDLHRVSFVHLDRVREKEYTKG